MAGLYPARDWDLSVGAVTTLRIPGPRPTGLKSVAAAALAATLLVLLVTGFRVGIGGGAFHVSLVRGYAPAMSGYASVPPVLANRLNHVLHAIAGFLAPLRTRLAAGQDLHALMLAGYLLSVLGGCFGLLWIVVRLAATDAVGLAAGALLFGITYLASGATLLSGESLAGGAFTATQVATALVALALALCLDGSLGVAVALLGVAFDAQPAVALWGVIGLAGASVGLVRDGVQVRRAWLIGGLCALVLAAPVAVLWAAQTAGSDGFPAGSVGVPGGSIGVLGGSTGIPGGSVGVPGGSVGVPGGSGFPGDIVVLSGAWFAPAEPGQTLPWTLPLQDWVLFGSAVVLGLSAFSVLGWHARGAFWAFVGFLVVFALGCAAPWMVDYSWSPTGHRWVVTAEQWLLVLRPMAVGTLLQLLATVAAIAVVLRDLRGGGGVLRVALSVIVGACLVLQPDLLPLAALAMLTRAAAAHGELLGLERRIRDCNQATLCRAALAVVVLTAVAGAVVRLRLPLP